MYANTLIFQNIYILSIVLKESIPVLNALGHLVSLERHHGEPDHGLGGAGVALHHEDELAVAELHGVAHLPPHEPGRVRSPGIHRREVRECRVLGQAHGGPRGPQVEAAIDDN